MLDRNVTAEFLIGQGLTLTPLVQGEKRPKAKGWQNGAGAITKVEEINGQDYGAMIQNGVLGIDIDVKNVDGIANFEKVLDGLELPETLSTRTASGGKHYYFRLPKGIAFTGPIKLDHLGLEVYTNKRQFCAVKQGYEVQLRPIAEAPPELLEKLDSLRSSAPTPTSTVSAGRNTSMISKVGVWLNLGIGDEVLMDLAHKENEKFEVPLPDEELVSLVHGASKRYRPGSLLQDWYLAAAIAETNVDRIRYCVEPNLFYVKGRTKWEPDPTLGLTTELINTARSSWIAEASRKPDKAKPLIKRLLDLGNVSKRKNVIEDLARQSVIQVSATERDCDPLIVGCANGWIDFRSVVPKFHEGCPASFSTMSLNASYDEEAKSPNWTRAIVTWFPDGEVRGFVQRVAGYILAGGNEREVLFFLQGPAASGKSKFTSGLLHVLGDYGIAIRVETITDKRRSAAGASEDLARMAGTRLAVTDEPAQGMRFNEALVKSLAGRDRINARGLYQKSFDFDARLVLMVHSNFDLYASADDGGFWRRMIKVPFVTRIAAADRDPKLLDKLKAESDGILQWAIRGWREYRRVGLDVPDVVRRACRKYRDSNDILADFVEDQCIVDEGARTKPKELYATYRSWCKEAGIKYPLKRRIFVEAIENRGFKAEDDGHGSPFFHGIGVAM